MDQLDQLFVELVEALRRERPANLTAPLEVSEMHEQLIPYRLVRNPAGLQSNADYETVLSRLISGERGYLFTEAPEMQEDVRTGLEESFADARRFLAYPEVRVWLNPAEIPAPGHIRYAPPEVQEEAARQALQAAVEAAHGAIDLVGEHEAPAPALGVDPEDTDPMAQRQAPANGRPEEQQHHEAAHFVPPEQRRSEGTPFAPAEQRLSEPAQVASGEPQESLPAYVSQPERRQPEPARFVRPDRCPQCDAGVPARDVNYCPHCGGRIARAICQVCGGEFEREWKFCGECGTPRGRRSARSA